MNKRLFAIGDIHGCFDAFQILLDQKIRLIKSDKVILLGDYIDRGTQSKQVIDYIIYLQAKGFDIVPLLGNHEAMLLDAYENEELVSIWIQNGGHETLKSFNISYLNDMEAKYIEFIKGLPCYYAFKEYLFVHAGFNDSVPNPFADKYSMIWTCRTAYENPLLINKIIIHAHRPIPVDVCKKTVHSNSSVINIDTGCVYSNIPGYGSLTAIELNTRSLYFAWVNLNTIFAIREFTSKGRIELVYIDKSGTIQQDGQSKGQGLQSRLNSKQEGIDRQEFFESQIIKENIDALDIYWFVTFDTKSKDLPGFVEGLLIQRFFEINGRLPLWNKDF